MQEKEKKYSVLSSVGYALAAYWQERKSLVIFAIIGVVMRVALPFAGIALPKIVIDQLTLGASPASFIASVGGLAAVMVVLNFWKSYTDGKIDEGFGDYALKIYVGRLIEKLIRMDYARAEDPEDKKRYDKAQSAANNNRTPMANLPRTVAELLVNGAGFLLYGTVIAAVHPLVIALLALSAGISWLMLRRVYKLEVNIRPERAETNKQLQYAIGAMHDREMAKDVRLYGMSEWVLRVLRQVFAKQRKTEMRTGNAVFATQLTDGLLILVRDGAAYAFLTVLLLQGRIDLGNFVMVFAAIGAFAGWTSGIIAKAIDVQMAAGEVAAYRRFLDLSDRSNTGPGAKLPPLDEGPGIRLEHVSYTYPGAVAPTLEGIDLDIRPGERIAIVGANGAGKTTLIKLICGLYRPDAGKIRLAGTDIAAYNRDEYFTLLSAVFQDIHLLPMSIAGNVSQRVPEETDRARVEDCLRRAGLYDKVQSLPEGMDTLLVREVHSTAIELSGGERQKLALARALYKDAPVILLDEPTAALDPIAESEVYAQYAALTEGKTSFYISHRLASTRFCDRVLLIDGHRIAEQGTHGELMRRGGKYATMFAIQASYYNSGEERPQDA